MPAMNFKGKKRYRRPSLGYAALALALALLTAPASGFGAQESPETEPGPSQSQIAAVQDSFDWADGVITALGELAPPFGPPPETQAWVHERIRRNGVRSRRPRPPFRDLVAPIFAGRHLLLHESTVFGIFDLTVNETSPNSFSMIVGSAEPAENIQVRDRISKAILVDQALDDEKVFMVKVGQALSPRIVISVSVVQDGEINKAYFPLLGSDSRI
jgi:hypothetical protein